MQQRVENQQRGFLCQRAMTLARLFAGLIERDHRLHFLRFREGDDVGGGRVVQKLFVNFSDAALGRQQKGKLNPLAEI